MTRTVFNLRRSASVPAVYGTENVAVSKSQKPVFVDNNLHLDHHSKDYLTYAEPPHNTRTLREGLSAQDENDFLDGQDAMLYHDGTGRRENFDFAGASHAVGTKPFESSYCMNNVDADNQDQLFSERSTVGLWSKDYSFGSRSREDYEQNLYPTFKTQSLLTLRSNQPKQKMPSNYSYSKRFNSASFTQNANKGSSKCFV